ncbi:unnamed protein product [Symbiodinium natans]|uniref:Uncharacterized protein n=1 Tax=Symbiodinium natans TaxID=878477 RepID=A0A812UTB9_9DINO|nr:unnamed protein product [Symbiodinium natans]
MAEEESEEKEAIPDDEVERLELLLSLPRTGPPSRPKLRSAKSGLGDAFDNVHAYGYLHDLAIRSQQNSRVTIPPVVWLRRQWRLLQDVTAAQLTTQLLRREQLTGLLLDGIVSESKKRGLFKKTSYPDYLQQARFVYSVSRESMLLGLQLKHRA